MRFPILLWIVLLVRSGSSRLIPSSRLKRSILKRIETSNVLERLAKCPSVPSGTCSDKSIVPTECISSILRCRGGGSRSSSSGSSSSSSSSSTPLRGGTTERGTGSGTATIPSHVFNLVKGIVGAGVLALPSGIAAYGNAPSAVIPAVLLIGLIGLLSAYGFALIGLVCSLTNDASSYREAWRRSVADESSWIPAVSVTFKTICSVLAYSMILGDTFQSLLSSILPTSTTSSSIQAIVKNKNAVLTILTTTVLLPLCLLKNLSSLAPFSLLGTLGMLYTAIAMSIRYFGKAYTSSSALLSDVPKRFQPSFGTAGASAALSPNTSILLGMLSTAYMAHFNAPKFYTELQNNTIHRYNKVVAISFGISIVLFAIITAVGFLTFGANSSGLILNNYSTRDTLMTLSRFAVALSLVFSYPLVFTGARDGIIDLFSIPKKYTANTAFLNTLTIAILSFVTILAMIIPDVSFVLVFAGATLGNALIYIFPAIMFRGAVKRMKNPSPSLKLHVHLATASAVIGTGLGIMGAVKAVQGIM